MKNKKILWWFIGGIVLGAIVGFFATAEHYGQIDLFKSHASEISGPLGGPTGGLPGNRSRTFNDYGGGQGNSCNSYQKCATGLLCIKGSCVQPTAPTPTPVQTPPPCSNNTTNGTNSCPNGQQCNNGICGTAVKCNQASDCKSPNQVCTGFNATPTPGSYAGTCVTAQACNLNDPNSAACTGVKIGGTPATVCSATGVCIVSGGYTPPCTGDTDCHYDHYCDMTQKPPACANGCNSNLGCPSGQYCNSGTHQCLAGCRSNNECPANLPNCENHVCKK